MGADNWAICPNCRKEAYGARKAFVLEVTKSYGKVPQEDFLRKMEEANKPVEIRETLREDYEVGVDSEGMFTVSYGCHCGKCGFKHDFKHEVDLMP